MDDISSPRTVRLLGQVNKKLVNVLLNTGFTHNFVDPRVVERTGLLVTAEQAFNVPVAGGDKLQNEGLYKAVKIKCQVLEIVTNFRILTIGGCQIVLGVNCKHL